MSGFSASAVLAVLLGGLLLPVLFVPYVGWSYRRRGTLSPGHAVVVAAAVVYATALWTYTIVPLPDPATLECAGDAPVQLLPLASLGDVDVATHGLRDPALVQLVANVALFVPFGMLVRHLLAPRRPAWVVVLAAAGTSLLVELTQLTGVWGLYPCAYRIFDVDDLLTNTLGATLGLLLAPLLRRIPGQGTVPVAQARVVGRGRRLVGMAVDVAAVHVPALVLYVGLALVARHRGWLGPDPAYDRLYGGVLLGVSLVLLLLVPRLTRGATPGQLLTYVRPVTEDGSAPDVRALLLRWASGSGAYFLLLSAGSLLRQDALGVLAHAWLVLAGAVVLLRHPRGLSGYVAGLTVVDSRDPGSTVSRARGVDPRSLTVAVLAVVTVAYLGYAAFAALAQVAPGVGAGVGLLGLLVLVLATLAVVPYLVVNGVVTVRREGLGALTVLPLVTAAAAVAVPVAVVVSILVGSRWWAALAVAVLAVSGYLGLLFVPFLVYGQWYARRRPDGPVDAVVVLGSRVFDDRVPPLLAARVDRGIEVLHEQLARDPGAPTVLVCSGGQGPDETMPEGTAMARYAVEHGAPAERVLAETASRTTEENLVLSRQLLHDKGLGEVVVVVTNDFHAFRAGIIAREVGVVADVVGAPTARYYFPAAVLREFVGVLARTSRLHAAVAGLLALVAAGLTVLLLG
ncbi:ElyC/SanA/YdcF family protein [Ornithinimicrobium sufpigmenti]|uniref:ElyC/SanA/YdcF family protein n=1 Tax=Ornithinimicrobium sufpigmenti TaxID=2508882 RepID=UPI001036DD27|nr:MULTISPECIES: ElyC/SanA/YdcF family protein [unclassified Ornithinimicrobium]